jgi:hypothetical protein
MLMPSSSRGRRGKQKGIAVCSAPARKRASQQQQPTRLANFPANPHDKAARERERMAYMILPLVTTTYSYVQYCGILDTAGRWCATNLWPLVCHYARLLRPRARKTWRQDRREWIVPSMARWRRAKHRQGMHALNSTTPMPGQRGSDHRRRGARPRLVR